MKLICDARELSESVTIAATVVPSRSSKAILMNLAFVAKDGILEILATDLEVGLRVTVRKVEIEQEGAILVNAGRMAQILKELGDDKVEISEAENSGCVIKGSGCRFHVYGEDYAEYPAIGRFGDEAGALSLPADNFQEMVGKTGFAAAVEKTRYAMNGIRCEINSERLCFVATDGRRLAMISRTLKKGVDEPIAVVVPTKAMNMVSRLLTAGEETIFMRFEETQVLIKSACAEISARLVEGHFPPYENVIPKDTTKVLTLQKEEFASKLRQASLMTTRESQTVKFAFEEGRLNLSARTVDIGESQVFMDLPYEGEKVAIGFNPQFVLDALKVMSKKDFKFRFSDPKGAALLEEENGLTYVVMPINLGEAD
jgi:DNA polymerase III subunit beta